MIRKIEKLNGEDRTWEELSKAKSIGLVGPL